MSLNALLAVPLATFPLIACAGSIESFSDEYPSIWLRLFGMNAEMGPVATSASYDAKANHNGSASPVASVGGSAGPHQTLLQFFPALPERTGMALQTSLHLPPDHESDAAAMATEAQQAT